MTRLQPLHICAFLLVSCTSYCTLAKRYRLSTKANFTTLMKEVPSTSVFTCAAHCEQTAGCHTTIWRASYPPCIFVNTGGGTLLSSLNSSLPFFTSRVDVSISLGSFGVSNDSDPKNAFSSDPAIYYKSAFRMINANVLGFYITFSDHLIVTAIQMTHVNLGIINQTVPSFLHWHVNGGLPYCDCPTPYPRPTGVVLQFNCASYPAVKFISIDVMYQGYLSFNNLRILGLNNEVVFP